MKLFGLWPFRRRSEIERSAVSRLANEIFASAQECRRATEEWIEQSSPDADERARMSVEAFREYIWFFLHCANRMAFLELGDSTSALLCHALVPMVAFRTRLAVTGDGSPFGEKDPTDSAFIDTYNMVEAEYGLCTEVVIDPSGEGLIGRRSAAGTKRRDHKGVVSGGLANQLAYNVADAISQPFDSAVEIAVTASALEVLKRKRINKLVSQAGAEIVGLSAGART